jgi:CSLREA domain-containing protein
MTPRLLVLAFAVAVTLAAARPAACAGFAVNAVADAPDASPGDGICETASGNGTCTLRAAVMEANALTGPDVVTLPAGTYVLTRQLEWLDPDTQADGDLDVTESLDLIGAGATTTAIQSYSFFDEVMQPHRILDVAAGAIAGVSGVTIGGGLAFANGGGIANAGNLTLSDCVLKDNFAGFVDTYDGGGIANAATGTLSVSRCTFANNRAGNGGGIANAGTASLEETTIEYNVAVTGGGAANSGTLTITNGTISGNATTVDLVDLDSYGGFGAAIADHGGLTTLEHVTVANSMVIDADFDGTLGTGAGLGVAVGVATVGYVLRDTIVWGSTGPSGGSTGDCGTPAPSSLGHNSDGDGTCLLTGTGDLPSTDPNLGPLENNGGPTRTHAIALGSPPYDAGDAGACPSTDQRGASRPQGAGCDIGAYEDNFPCNNGTLDAGEACDDGSPVAGDCCAFDCTFVASGVACEDSNPCTQSQCDGGGACVVATNVAAGTYCNLDSSFCTIERCDGAGTCAAAGNITCSPCRRCVPSGFCVDNMLTGCRRPTVAGASRLTLKPELGRTPDLVKWRWARGQETASDDFGDPAATDDYQLCIFETTGSASQLMQGTAFPAGGTCGDGPCWTPLGTPPGERGFRYENRDPLLGFAGSLLLRPGAEGRAQITARTRTGGPSGTGLFFRLDADPPVKVQLQREDGTCWEAVYTTPLVSTDTRFRARSDP